MANEVHLNGTNKMRDFSNDECVCIYLFRYHFVKLVNIVLYLHVASSRDVLDSVINSLNAKCVYACMHTQLLHHSCMS